MMSFHCILLSIWCLCWPHLSHWYN